MGELTLEQRRVTTTSQPTTYQSRWLRTGFLCRLYFADRHFRRPDYLATADLAQNHLDLRVYPITILPTIAQWGNYYTAVIGIPLSAMRSIRCSLPCSQPCLRFFQHAGWVRLCHHDASKKCALCARAFDDDGAAHGDGDPDLCLFLQTGADQYLLALDFVEIAG